MGSVAWSLPATLHMNAQETLVSAISRQMSLVIAEMSTTKTVTETGQRRRKNATIVVVPAMIVLRIVSIRRSVTTAIVGGTIVVEIEAAFVKVATAVAVEILVFPKYVHHMIMTVTVHT